MSSAVSLIKRRWSPGLAVPIVFSLAVCLWICSREIRDEPFHLTDATPCKVHSANFVQPNNTLKHQGKCDRKIERLGGGAKTDLLAGLQELLNNVSSDHGDPADA